MGVFVKICGLCRRDDVEAVAALQPDAVGFVLWPRSKRGVTVEQVAGWTRLIPASIRKVGVFVDASPAEVDTAMKQAGLEIAQLHGAESPETVAEVSYPVWKALSATDKEWSRALSAYSVDAFLVDSYSTESPGGTGRVGDWKLAREVVKRSRFPVILAGGLHPGNVLPAIAEVRPWGVDVSSGVESSPGRKDIRLVKAFIEQCRNS